MSKNSKRYQTNPRLLSLPQSTLFRIFSYLDIEIVESILPIVSKKCYKKCFTYRSLPSHRMTYYSFSPFLDSLSIVFLQLLTPYLSFSSLIRTFPFLSKTCYTIFRQYLRTIRHAKFINEFESVVLRVLYLAPSLQTLSVHGHCRISSVTICALAEERDLCPNLTEINLDRIPQITTNQLHYLYSVRNLSIVLHGTLLQPDFMHLSDVLRSPEEHFQRFVDFCRPLHESDSALFWRRITVHETQLFSDSFFAKQQVLKIWNQFLATDSPFEIKVDQRVWETTKKWVDLIRAPGQTPKPKNATPTTTITYPTTPSRTHHHIIPPSPISLSRHNSFDNSGLRKSKTPTPLKLPELQVPAFEFPPRRKSLYNPSVLHFLQEVQESDESRSGRKVSPPISTKLPPRRLSLKEEVSGSNPLPSRRLSLTQGGPRSNKHTPRRLSVNPENSLLPLPETSQLVASSSRESQEGGSLVRQSPKVPLTRIGSGENPSRKLSFTARLPIIGSGSPTLLAEKPAVYEPLVHSTSLSASSVAQDDDELSSHQSVDPALESVSRAIRKTQSREEEDFSSGKSEDRTEHVRRCRMKLFREEDDDVPLSISSSTLAPLEITAKSSRVDELSEVDQPPPAFMFSAIQDYIYYSLMNTVFSSFKLTPEYQLIIRAVTKPKAEPSNCPKCCIIL